MPLRLGHVPGAAGSGTKFANVATTERKTAWTCSQGHANKGYWLRCMETGCNEKRPSQETPMSENLYDEKHDEAADKHGAPTTTGDTGGAPLSGKNPAGYDEVEAMQAKPLGTEEIGSGLDWKRER